MLAAALALAFTSNDIRPLLREQCFEWTLARSESDIEYVGDIKTGGRTYSFYLYNGVNPENRHGINRFIIVLGQSVYLGTYEAGSAHDCRINKQTVVCKADFPGRRIQFTKNGPPREIWFDGEINNFWPAPSVKRKTADSRK